MQDKNLRFSKVDSAVNITYFDLFEELHSGIKSKRMENVNDLDAKILLKDFVLSVTNDSEISESIAVNFLKYFKP